MDRVVFGAAKNRIHVERQPRGLVAAIGQAQPGHSATTRVWAIVDAGSGLSGTRGVWRVASGDRGERRFDLRQTTSVRCAQEDQRQMQQVTRHPPRLREFGAQRLDRLIDDRRRFERKGCGDEKSPGFSQRSGG